MSVLRVYVPANLSDAGWRWALCNKAGVVLQEGDQDCVLPSVETCEMVLAVGLCRFAAPTLPPGITRQGEAMLGFALEEGLLNAPEENHYSLRTSKNSNLVCLIARASLQPVLDWLASAGLYVTRIVPEELCLPRPPIEGWTLALFESGWGLRLASGRALCVPLLGDVLWETLRMWAPPTELLFCGEAAVPAALQDLPVTKLTRPDWRTAQPDPAHDFAIKRGRWRLLVRQGGHFLRQGIRLLVALVLFDLALLAGEWSWLRWQQAHLATTVVEEAQRMGIHALTDEVALNLARRQVAGERTRHGQAQDGDLLPMLAAVQPLLPEGVALHRLRYRQGELQIEGEGLPRTLSSAQRARLEAHGWSMRVPAEEGALTLRFAATPREGNRP